VPAQDADLGDEGLEQGLLGGGGAVAHGPADAVVQLGQGLLVGGGDVGRGEQAA